MSLSFIRAVVLVVGFAFVGALSTGPAAADSIYDANVVSQLKLDAAQKGQVTNIVAQSKAQMMAIFKQYNIDPNATPVFDKLQKATGPLQAVARQERQAMSKVLRPDQMKQYDEIIEATRTRVRKAAK